MNHCHAPIIALALLSAPMAVAPTPTPGDDTDTLADAARYTGLTPLDYRQVAEELGVETAAMKAVVDIEAGSNHRGFYAPAKPLINFDLSVFRRAATRKGVRLKQAQREHPEVFASPDSKRYGSRQAAQQVRLDGAVAINHDVALESTFWGMFQIGGFNWRRCGCASVDDFVEQMSLSERSQLELFASFLRNTGLVEPLKKKDWAAFARGYNGPAYARRGYHTRMADAYKRYREQELRSEELQRKLLEGVPSHHIKGYEDEPVVEVLW